MAPDRLGSLLEPLRTSTDLPCFNRVHRPKPHDLGARELSVEFGPKAGGELVAAAGDDDPELFQLFARESLDGMQDGQSQSRAVLLTFVQPINDPQPRAAEARAIPPRRPTELEALLQPKVAVVKFDEARFGYLIRFDRCPQML